MVKNFIFIEDGSVDLENMRKILDNSGNTDVKFITYRQGAAKPELVSIERSDATQNPEVYKEEAKEKLLSVLLDYLHIHTIKSVERHHNYLTITDDVIHKMLYLGTPESFIEHFKNFMDNVHDERVSYKKDENN